MATAHPHAASGSPPDSGTWLRSAGALALVAAIAAVGYAVVLHPRFRALGELRARELRAARVAAAVTDVSLEELRGAVAALPNADREAMDALAPPGEDVPGLFVALDAAAQRVGIGITAMEATREERGTGIPDDTHAIAVALSIRNTDYGRLKAFLRVLERSQRLMDVRSVQFTPSALSASVRLRAYSVE